ncbi:iron ABC transporter ATP-binding protein [Arcobacter sp. F155]|uniref:ABC transporter ATP-binding protein n=1 Tax=Arcobacter sp. F155 TaxID=2044512 RepID=UPI00100B4ACB|nr:ABC transporter ATP-binding protein [Arcobacter sp. F155]RXJ77091.1 iron ABC transporter ATP-binding protein [Arcobacter sp. F155]
MIELDKINFSVKKKKILKEISFNSQENNLIAIIGPNGSGKSTLLKVLRNLLCKDSGDINLYEKKLESYSNKELAKLISYLPQTTKAVNCLVEDCILLGRKPHMKILPSKEDKCKCEEVIKSLNLEKLAKENILNLSGGQLQKVLIGRSLVQDSNVLFLDEPINHLDIKNQLEIMNLTKKVTYEKSLLTFVVLHDLNLAFKYANDILLLKEGKIIFFGKKSELKEQILRDTYDVDLRIINHENEIKVVY